MGDKGDVLEPGAVIKPQMTKEDATALLLRLYGLRSTSVKEFNSYDDRNFYFKVAADTTNPNLDTVSEDGYILKVTNRQDSKDPAFTDAQNLMILHMAKAGLSVPEPQEQVCGVLASLEVGVDRSGPAIANIVRLLKFVPGKTFYEIGEWSTAHFHQCGEFVGRMDASLAAFAHPAYDTRNSIWFLSSMREVRAFLPSVAEAGRRALVAEVIDQFCSTVLPVVGQLDQQIIHGDFNEQNILCREGEGGKQEVYSVIDFGDSQRNPVLYELGITIMYMMTRCTVVAPHLAGGHVVAGYLGHRQLTPLERRLLRVTVAARYAQSLVMGAYSYSQDPGNEYLLITAHTGWSTLAAFWATEPAALYRAWDATILGHHPHLPYYLSSAL